MSVYLLSYDLRKPGRNYQGLYDALAKVDCVRALESVWLLEAPQTATQLREAVLSHLDTNDGVLVVEIASGAGWAYSSIRGAAGNWLRRKRP